MHRRLPGESAGKYGAEIEGLVARDLTGDPRVSAPRAWHRPAHLASRGNEGTQSEAARRRSPCDLSAMPGERYESDTITGARGIMGGSFEVSSILRWALADLALALLEIERQPALSSHETKSAGGPGRRLPVSN